MKTRKILSIALFSVFLTACSSGSGGGGGGNGIRPGTSSLNDVPVQYRAAVSKAKTASLSLSEGGNQYKFTVDGKTGEYNFSDLPNGRTDLPISLSYQTVQGAAATATGSMLVYQQPYSVVTGETWSQDSGDNFENDELGIFYATEIVGFITPASAITELTNQNAIFDYKGVAFDGQEQGTLNYTMNFGTRKGSGSITGFTRTGSIELSPSNKFITGATINGTHVDILVGGSVRLEKVPEENDLKYKLSFFGPNAEELAGKIDGHGQSILGKNDIIFAGKR